MNQNSTRNGRRLQGIGEPLGRPGRPKSPRVAKEREKEERGTKGESKYGPSAGALDAEGPKSEN